MHATSLPNPYQLAANRYAPPADDPYPTPGAMAVALEPATQVQRAHLEAIDAAVVDLAEGRTNRLMIFAPPQSGKSQRAAIWTPAWWLRRNPTHRIVLVSYAAGLATRSSRLARGIVREHGPKLGLALDPSLRAGHEWALTTRGGMFAAGRAGGITGRPADLGIVDDPFADRPDAESPAAREEVWDMWSASFVTRLAPFAPVMVMNTRWHPDDLSGRLLEEEGRVEEGGRWTVLHLAAVEQARDPEHDSPIWRYPDPLGRAPGEPLPHPKIALGDVEKAAAHWRDKRATVTVRDWHALYQGDPRPAEGALLTRAMLRQRRDVDGIPEPRRTVVAIDPSGGGADECGLLAGELGVDGRARVTHDWSEVMPSYRWGREACLLALEVDADCFVVEHNFGADMAGTILRQAWEALERDGGVTGLMPRIKVVNAKHGKLIRAEPVAQAIVEDRARFAGVFPELEEQWATYAPGSTDSPDRMDAHVYLVMELLPGKPKRKPGPAQVVAA